MDYLAHSALGTLLYIDPGSGAMLMQAITGLIAGVGYSLFRFRHALARFLHVSRSEDTPPDDAQS